jgi:hypothetical protein
MCRLVIALVLCLCTLCGQQKKQAAAPRLSAGAQRNENVAVHQIDTNAIKESNIRLGDWVTIVSEMPAENNYYAAEHGQAPPEQVALRPVTRRPGWHAEAFESHQNSILNARTFFQAGPVQPSRRNFYGFRGTGAASGLGYITATASQRKIRGMVNGNVLVPLASERTPLATDPAVRRIVASFLAAYPAALPNRLDYDPRALNTNAPQSSDETDASLRLEPARGLSVSHALLRSRQDAFQFVAGQNPDTEIHSHRSRITWRIGGTAVGFAFNRTRSLLTPEPNAVGPRVRMGFQIEELGPDSMFPIDRAQNSFRWGVVAERTRGSHALIFGGDITRFQLNGIEVNNSRGYFQFTNNFGRSALENLRLGTPSVYEVTLGELSRGFRNWGANLFLGDKWNVSQRLQLYYGLRYNLETSPIEVRGLTDIPYGCDCNNFSPRFSIAFDAGRGWVVRSAYATTFGQILPVTYQQARNNLPLVRYVQVQNPNLVDPLQGIDLTNASARTSPTVLSSDMVSPYSHQYNFGVERRLAGGALVRAGYVGSRSFKLLNSYIHNRAEPVAGIPLTTATVDARRPDPRFYEIKYILNGGIAYMDAAQLTLQLPVRRGLGLGATYTFGKALDEGSDYAFTAANKDLTTARSQYQYEAQKDKKGLSTFDSTHAFLLTYSYDLPQPANRWTRVVARGWQVSGVTLLKSGTPLTLYIGSDAPGFGNVDGGPSDRPNILDPSILGRSISHPDEAPLILTRDRFAYITPGERRGSLGRNSFRKSPIANFNAALSRQWHWSARREWIGVFRIEAYNLANHAQFDEPQRNYSSPAFGKITNALNDGRVFQLSLRFIL